MIWTMMSFGGEPDIKSMVEPKMAINFRHPRIVDFTIISCGKVSQ